MFQRNYMKSAQCAYNNSAQTVVSDGTTLDILGTQVCNTGVSLATGTTGFTVGRSGIYRFSFDVDYTAGAAAGTVTLQLYNGLATIPGATATCSAAAAGLTSMHVETVLNLNSCCGNTPFISAQVSGLAGTVTNVCANAVKLA